MLSLMDRQFNSHEQDGPSLWHVRTYAINGLLTEKFDAIALSYPSTTVDVAQYYQGGLSGTLVMTITTTYNNPAHQKIVSVVRT